ncbi:MAG: amino acid permease, partial [Catenulispora sp.]
SAAVVKYFATTPNEENIWRRLVAPAVSTVLLIVMAWLCVDHYDVLLNVPPGSLATKVLPGIFAVAAVVGIGWALVLKRLQPEAYDVIGYGGAAALARTTALATPSAAAASVERTVR